MQGVTELPYAHSDTVRPPRAASRAISFIAHAAAAAVLLATFSTDDTRPAPPPRTISVAPLPQADLAALARTAPAKLAPPSRQTAPAEPAMLKIDDTPWAQHADAPDVPVAQAMVVGAFDAGTKLAATSAAVVGRVALGGLGGGGASSEGSSSAAAGDSPLRVLSEPVPHYPEEAQRLGITGEVLLLVRFSASGDLRVVRTISGLGHGLDEAAIAAAQQVRFAPAVERGRPVDVVMQISVVFKL
jgi:TonB family protein